MYHFIFLVIDDVAINISDLAISMFFNFITRIFMVKGSLVLQDLLIEFLDCDIMTCKLKVIMVDGHGKDETGKDPKRNLTRCPVKVLARIALRKGEGSFHKAQFSERHMDCRWTVWRSGVFCSDVKQSICDQYYVW